MAVLRFACFGEWTFGIISSMRFQNVFLFRLSRNKVHWKADLEVAFLFFRKLLFLFFYVGIYKNNKQEKLECIGFISKKINGNGKISVKNKSWEPFRVCPIF